MLRFQMLLTWNRKSFSKLLPNQTLIFMKAVSIIFSTGQNTFFSKRLLIINGYSMKSSPFALVRYYTYHQPAFGTSVLFGESAWLVVRFVQTSDFVQLYSTRDVVVITAACPQCPLLWNVMQRWPSCSVCVELIWCRCCWKWVGGGVVTVL